MYSPGFWEVESRMRDEVVLVTRNCGPSGSIIAACLQKALFYPSALIYFVFSALFTLMVQVQDERNAAKLRRKGEMEREIRMQRCTWESDLQLNSTEGF